MREGTSTVGTDKPSEEFSANVAELFLRGGKFFAPFSAQLDKFKHENWMEKEEEDTAKCWNERKGRVVAESELKRRNPWILVGK